MDYSYVKDCMEVLKTTTLAAEEVPVLFLPAECSDCYHYNGCHSKVVQVEFITYEDHRMTISGYCEMHKI